MTDNQEKIIFNTSNQAAIYDFLVLLTYYLCLFLPLVVFDRLLYFYGIHPDQLVDLNALSNHFSLLIAVGIAAMLMATISFLDNFVHYMHIKGHQLFFRGKRIDIQNVLCKKTLAYLERDSLWVWLFLGRKLHTQTGTIYLGRQFSKQTLADLMTTIEQLKSEYPQATPSIGYAVSGGDSVWILGMTVLYEIFSAFLGIIMSSLIADSLLQTLSRMQIIYTIVPLISMAVFSALHNAWKDFFRLDNSVYFVKNHLVYLGEMIEIQNIDLTKTASQLKGLGLLISLFTGRAIYIKNPGKKNKLKKVYLRGGWSVRAFKEVLDNIKSRQYIYTRHTSSLTSMSQIID